MFESLNTDINAVISSVESAQQAYVLANGKFEQTALTEGTGFTYEVHEHVTPTGVGFTIKFYATDNGKDYVKMVGHGEGSNTKDWTEIVEDNI